MADRAPPDAHRGGMCRRGGPAGRGSLRGDDAGGKEHDEEDDDENDHADEDNHLHVLPPELPSHLLRCCLEVLRLRGIRRGKGSVPLPTGAGVQTQAHMPEI